MNRRRAPAQPERALRRALHRPRPGRERADARGGEELAAVADVGAAQRAAPARARGRARGRRAQARRARASRAATCRRSRRSRRSTMRRRDPSAPTTTPSAREPDARPAVPARRRHDARPHAPQLPHEHERERRAEDRVRGEHPGALREPANQVASPVPSPSATSSARLQSVPRGVTAGSILRAGYGADAAARGAGHRPPARSRLPSPAGRGPQQLPSGRRRRWQT